MEGTLIAAAAALILFEAGRDLWFGPHIERIDLGLLLVTLLTASERRPRSVPRACRPSNALHGAPGRRPSHHDGRRDERGGRGGARGGVGHGLDDPPIQPGRDRRGARHHPAHGLDAPAQRGGGPHGRGRRASPREHGRGPREGSRALVHRRPRPARVARLGGFYHADLHVAVPRYFDADQLHQIDAALTQRLLGAAGRPGDATRALRSVLGPVTARAARCRSARCAPAAFEQRAPLDLGERQAGRACDGRLSARRPPPRAVPRGAGEPARPGAGLRAGGARRRAAPPRARLAGDEAHLVAQRGRPRRRGLRRDRSGPARLRRLGARAGRLLRHRLPQPRPARARARSASASTARSSRWAVISAALVIQDLAAALPGLRRAAQCSSTRRCRT
ncbi:MAG: hypothetical protein MZV64_72310 [Ignavibacteriales bacterium]|nr:hypothetical protein [Ignavibacteriales bacterium]